MYEMNRQIQMIVDEIERCIEQRSNEELTLLTLSRKLGYSEFYVARKFKEISGMNFKDYLRRRKLAFALKDIRDSKRGILDIALDYGFSTHEAFTRSFKAMYGITPGEYRKKPIPLVLRTKLCPFDRYFLEPVQNLFKIIRIKAMENIWKEFWSLRSQFFQRRRHLSSQPKERSTIQRFGRTAKICSSFLLTTSTSALEILLISSAKFSPV